MAKNTTSERAKADLASDAAQAVAAVAHAADEATKAIASAAAEAIKVASQNDAKTSGDHDLIVELRVKMDDLKSAVEKLASKDSQYVLKDEFVVWRTILISGMFLSITVAALSRFLTS